jgi:branched-chain amino acid aminotransferase
VLAWPWELLLGADGAESGVRITVSPWVKFHSSMMPTTAKACGQYLNSILAVHDAHARGFDEALLLDVDGNIAEGPGENLFVVKDGRLRTNDERSSILLGVTRNAVIQIARDLGYEVEVGTLTLDELTSADEAFFTGTAAEVAPIRELDGVEIGNGKRGPITARIQESFASAVNGRDARYREWLHFVAAESVSASSGAVSL